MTLRSSLLATLTLMVLGVVPANAQCAYTATAEPGIGSLATGVTICVDDRTCGPGKIKEVTGGSRMPFVKRTRKCVAHKA